MSHDTFRATAARTGARGMAAQRTDLPNSSEFARRQEMEGRAVAQIGNGTSTVPSGADGEQQQMHRHRRPVRELLRLREQRGLEWFEEYVRGWPGFEQCRNDFTAQWNAGNRGAYGDWRA